MKKIIVIISFVGISLATSSAQLIAYEPFAGLTIGTGISGSAVGAFGWTGPWAGAGTSDNHFQITDPTPDLSYQIVSGTLLQGGDRALILTTNPEPLASPIMVTRSFAPINTTFYISLLLRLSSSGTGSDSIDIHLLRDDVTIVRFPIRPENPGPPAGVLWNVTGLNEPSGSPQGTFSDNAKTFLVVIEAKVAGANPSYWVNAFVNPGITYPGLPASSGRQTDYFNGIGLSVRSTDTAGPTTTVILDEIRIGYTWGDVVPPNPVPALVPDVLIAQAAKIRWQSQTGKTYQIQYSYDLITWFNFGTAVSGNNQIKEVFDSADSDAKKFYRIKIQ